MTDHIAKDANPDIAARQAFYINNFDLVRLFAAFQVAIIHAYHRLDMTVPWIVEPLSAFPGVPVFFIISGYLISASLDRSTSLTAYARNRALRIFPGLWGVLIVTALVLAMLGMAEASPRFLGWFIAQCAGLIYTPGFLRGFGDGTYNGSLWTIPIELQFYVMLPLLYVMADRLGMKKTPFLACAFFAFLIIGGGLILIFPQMGVDDAGSYVKLIRYSFVARFYMFLFGVMLQRLQVHRWALIRGKALFWIAACLLYHYVGPKIGVSYMGGELLLGITAISAAYTVPTLADRLLRGTDISYGVYLYHGLILSIVIDLAMPNDSGTLLLAMTLSLMAGTLSWFLIERPVLRNKWLRSWPMPARHMA